MVNVIDMQIAGVDHVHGSELCDHWSSPMTIVINSNGDKFITFGEDYLRWLSLVGEVVTVELSYNEMSQSTWVNFG